MNDAGKEFPAADTRCRPVNKAGVFVTTHWSVVLEACKGDSPGAFRALEDLCRTYWYPIYAFIRRRGHAAHESEDLTQAFFEHVLEREALKTVDRGKGQFRSFLFAAVTNFLNNEWDKLRTQKRGGQYQILSLDAMAPEDLYRCEPVDNLTPERLFERRWAFVLVEQALTKLRTEYQRAGKADLFQKLQTCLTSEGPAGFLSATAKSLGMSEGALKVALHRLRRRFGQALQEQVAFTVSSDEQVDEEIRHLLTAISDE